MKKHLLAVFERAGWTFAQAFAAALTVSNAAHFDVNALKVAAVAGGYSVAKYVMVLAGQYTDSKPAASSPAPQPPVH